MNSTENDYPYSEYQKVMTAVYIILCITCLLINFNVIALVVRSKRMLRSPKYWLVFATSLVFIFQSAVSNNVLVNEWLSNETTRSSICKMAKVFNRYIGMGIVTWASFIINVDYLICMKSSAYTRYYRVKVITFLMIATWAPVIAAVVSISVLTDTNSSATSVMLNNSNHQILLWVTLFAPLVLSILCCAAVVIWRSSAKLQTMIVTNEDVSDPVDTSACPFLPPADHITFVLTLVLLYVPAAIVSYDQIWPDERNHVIYFWIVCTVLRDNAGSLAPFSWFLFKDIRLACRKCVTSIGMKQQDALTESSEMNIYDSYPYCSRIQI